MAIYTRKRLAYNRANTAGVKWFPRRRGVRKFTRGIPRIHIIYSYATGRDAEAQKARSYVAGASNTESPLGAGSRGARASVRIAEEQCRASRNKRTKEASPGPATLRRIYTYSLLLGDVAIVLFDLLLDNVFYSGAEGLVAIVVDEYSGVSVTWRRCMQNTGSLIIGIQ